jgi:hypothetical protein
VPGMTSSASGGRVGLELALTIGAGEGGSDFG